jgi:sorting and assembly machinery component 37
MDLHIWGPIGSLPSLDAECIAAVAYLSRALPAGAWRLVASSDPSITPNYLLPALHDGDVWISGFSAIVAHMTPSLDAGLSPTQRAEAVAYSAFLASSAQPLVDASLYASEENWAAVTRPAFGRMLPFPVSWMLPHAMRGMALARAERLPATRLLGLLEQSGDEEEEVRDLLETPTTMTQTLANKLRRPKEDVASRVTKKVVRERMEEQVRDLLEPVIKRLEESDEDVPTFFGPVSSLDCLAYGYLALLELDVPQTFAKTALAKTPVGRFVQGMGMRTTIEPTALSNSVPRSVFRFIDQLVRTVPVLGDEYAAEVARSHSQNVAISGHGATLLTGVLAAGLALGGGYYSWRAMQPFGLPVHTFMRGR